MIWGAFSLGLALGVGLGFVLVLIAGYNPSHRAPRAHLPPATARQLRRARRESRLQIDAPRWIAPARTNFEGEP